jgi:hypothetical protein
MTLIREVPVFASSQPNKRLLPRSTGNTFGPLRLKSAAESFTAAVHDFNVLGIGLIGEANYAVGSCFIVEEGPKRIKPLQPLTAELRHATPLESGKWLLGCQFSRPLTTDDVQVLAGESN